MTEYKNELGMYFACYERLEEILKVLIDEEDFTNRVRHSMVMKGTELVVDVFYTDKACLLPWQFVRRLQPHGYISTVTFSDSPPQGALKTTVFRMRDERHAYLPPIGGPKNPIFSIKFHQVK